MVWFTPAIAILIVVLYIIIGKSGMSESGRRLISSLVYTTLIGLPSSVLLNAIAHTFSHRFGRWIWLVYSAVIFTIATLGSFLAAILLIASGVIPHGLRDELRLSWPLALLISFVVGLSMISFETMRFKLQTATLALRTQEAERERAYKLLAEAQLSSLESRIHPHFLFNTLNSIAALIPSDPRRAEDTVAKLASLLRFSLTANPSGLVPLARELKIVHDYLEIESTRFGPRLRYEIAVSEDLLDLRTPPLSLATLVENAVKHVASQRPEGAHIRVTGARRDSGVLLEVIDNGPGFALSAIPPDHGLGNLIARLELLFGDRAALRVARRENETVVSIEFPAGDAP
ncbi:MAG TPA: histidine kinase [Terracidiphilus sp.]|nr:histidine kinase [Terracidiphilus sp.]